MSFLSKSFLTSTPLCLYRYCLQYDGFMRKRVIMITIQMITFQNTEN